MNETIDTVASYILASLLLPNLIFTVRYFLRSPYQRTQIGRNLLYQKAAVSALLIVLALSIFLGTEYPGRPFVRLIVFSAITFFYWVELAQLIKVQREFPYRRRFRQK